MEFTTGQKIPGKFLEALLDAGILYTTSDGQMSQQAGSKIDVPTVRSALTPRQYNRLVGFITAHHEDGQSGEIRTLSQWFDPAQHEIPAGAIPDRPSKTEDINHGRFQSIVDEIFLEADAVIEEQQESNSSVADIVDSTNNTQSSPERYCQITQYDSDQQQGTIEFLDSVESESTAFSLEDHINLRIKTNAKYIASVTEDADCARIAQLRRHGEYGPAITPVQGDIGAISADVIVCPTGTRLVMRGGVAGQLRSIGGDDLAEAVESRDPRAVGEVVVTKAYDLDAKYVLHAITDSDSKSVETTPAILRKLIEKVVTVADERDARIVATPLLGCGAAGVNPEVGIPAIIDSLRSHGYHDTEYRVVVNDTEEYELITDAIQS